MIYRHSTNVGGFARPDMRIGLNQLGWQVTVTSLTAVTVSARRRSLIAIRMSGAAGAVTRALLAILGV